MEISKGAMAVVAAICVAGGAGTAYYATDVIVVDRDIGLRAALGVNHRRARRRLKLLRLLDEKWTKAVAGERQGQCQSHRAGTHNQNVC